MICSRPQFLSLICILTTSVAGCSSNDAPKPEPVQDNATVSQKIVFDSAQMGEGLYMLAFPTNATSAEEEEVGRLTDNTCVSLQSRSEELLDSAEFSSFVLQNDASIYPRLLQHLPNDTLFSTYDSRIEQHYEAFFNGSNENEEIISVLATIRTTKEELLGELTNFGDESPCYGEEEKTPGEFFDTCGHRFLQKQERGLLLLLSASVGELKPGDKSLLDNILNANLVHHDEDLDVAMQRLNNELPNVHFRVTPLTQVNASLEPRDVLLLNDKLPSANWGRYRDQLRGNYVSRAGSLDVNFGEILDQHFEDYSFEFFDACRVPEMPPTLICYYDFIRDVSDFYRGRQDFARQRELIIWMLDNPDRVRWTASRSPNDPNGEPSVGGTMERYQQALFSLNQCFQQFVNDGILDMCHEALLNGEETCGSEHLGAADPCQLHSCHPTRLDALIEQLPEAVILSSAAATEHIESAQVTQSEPALGTSADRFCVLSSLSGAFQGGGERASLTFDAGANEWRISINSQTKEPDAQIIAGQECVPTDYFQGSTAFSNFEQQSFQEDANGFFYLDDERFAAALGGISGRMAGGGEYALIDYDTSVGTKLELKSQQGFLRGYANTFGVHDPANQQVQFATDAQFKTQWKINTNASGENEVLLAPIDEGVCYLTRIKGKFDGGAERISLRPDGRNWVLRVRAACAQRGGVFKGGECEAWKHVEAEARCYKYAQD